MSTAPGNHEIGKRYHFRMKSSHATMQKSSPARLRRNRQRALRHTLVRLLCISLDGAAASDSSDSDKFRADRDADSNTCSAVSCSGAADPVDDPCSIGGFIVDVLGLMQESSLGCAMHHRKMAGESDESGIGRKRDLFPLPFIREWPNCIEPPFGNLTVLADFANLVISALNYLKTGMRLHRFAAPVRMSPSSAQLSAQMHIAGRVALFLRRMSENCGEHMQSEGIFKQFEESSGSGAQPLRSDSVDLPSRAATCNPKNLIGSNRIFQDLLDAESILQDVPADVDFTLDRAFKHEAEKKEYIKLTHRELCCGKLRLQCHVKGGGAVFAVGKANKSTQRKVWHGAAVSECAKRPPKPYRLANPSSFLELDVDPNQELFFSKRDASTFFDVLRSPQCLHGYFAQPGIALSELMEVSEMSFEEVRGFVNDPIEHLDSNTRVYPVHVVWPMGFSWSSAVGQACSVSCCVKAGIPENCIVSLDHEITADQNELAFVATDDVLMIHRDRELAFHTTARLDAEMVAAGMPPNPHKSITAACSITGLGCELSSKPPLCQPMLSKLRLLALGYLDLLRHPLASPRGLNAALGLSQWFCLMQRGLYSVYDEIYRFVRLEPLDRTIPVPDKVQDEILVSLLLLPLLPASLDRQWLEEVIATDASQSYGFGVVTAPFPRADVAKIGRLAEKRGDYVRLYPSVDDASYLVDRIGVPHEIDLAESDFKVAIMRKAKWKAHSSVLEGHALLLGCRRLVRERSKHHTKAVFLVDAKSILGAVVKGRSSSVLLRSICREFAALTLAADVLPRLVYIPSESNPSDKASRGKVLRPKVRTARRASSKRSRPNRDNLQEDYDMIDPWSFPGLLQKLHGQEYEVYDVPFQRLPPKRSSN